MGTAPTMRDIMGVLSVFKRADLGFIEDSDDTRPGHPDRS